MAVRPLSPRTSPTKLAMAPTLSPSRANASSSSLTSKSSFWMRSRVLIAQIEVQQDSTRRSRRRKSARKARQKSLSGISVLNLSSWLATRDRRKEGDLVVRSNWSVERYMLLVDRRAKSRDVRKRIRVATTTRTQKLGKSSHGLDSGGQIEPFLALADLLLHPGEIEHVHASCPRRVWASPACR